MKSLILPLSGIVFSSCMHMGMPMMHRGDDHQPGMESVLEKEVIAGDVKAVAVFPPLEPGKDVLLTLRLVDAKTEQPISGATVYLHAQYFHKLDSHEGHEKPTTHEHSDSGRSQRIEREHDIHIDEDVQESGERGVYSISYGSSHPGEHTLMIHITAIGDRKLDPEITIEAKRTLADQPHEHGGGMMGMSSTASYVVVGAAVMGAMMVAMLVARDRMF
jgi:hypothetical protein